MKGLLDTHTFLWWVTNQPQLSERVKLILSDRNNQIFFSAASGWEIAIKAQLGKLEIPNEPEAFIANQLELNSFQILPIELKHTLHIYHLPIHHKDPFDRMIAATALISGDTLVSRDEIFDLYGVARLWD